jgi:hypothetical protein
MPLLGRAPLAVSLAVVMAVYATHAAHALEHVLGVRTDHQAASGEVSSAMGAFLAEHVEAATCYLAAFSVQPGRPLLLCVAASLLAVALAPIVHAGLSGVGPRARPRAPPLTRRLSLLVVSRR